MDPTFEDDTFVHFCIFVLYCRTQIGKLTLLLQCELNKNNKEMDTFRALPWRTFQQIPFTQDDASFSPCLPNHVPLDLVQSRTAHFFRTLVHLLLS